MDLTITAAATKRIEELTSQEKSGAAFRVIVAGGGCSGYQYEFDYKAQHEEGDITIECGAAKVFVDPASLELLQGCTVDYTEDLGGASFVINNPNATAKCGCGKSFAL